MDRARRVCRGGGRGGEPRDRAAGSLSSDRNGSRRDGAGVGSVRPAVGDRRARDAHPDDPSGDHEPVASGHADRAVRSVSASEEKGRVVRRDHRADAARHQSGGPGRRSANRRTQPDDVVRDQLYGTRRGARRARGQRARVDVRRGEHQDPRRAGGARCGVPQDAAGRREETARCAGSAHEHVQAEPHRRAAAAGRGQSRQPGAPQHAAAAERREPDSLDGSEGAPRAPIRRHPIGAGRERRDRPVERRPAREADAAARRPPTPVHR